MENTNTNLDKDINKIDNINELNNNEIESNILIKFIKDIDNNDFLNESYETIKNILGENFELSWINDIKELENKKILNFKFINKTGIKNSEKSEYINDKIELLKNNKFIEIDNLKISGIGRFIRVYPKSIQDYEKEKIDLLEEFTNKIKLIDEKIKILST